MSCRKYLDGKNEMLLVDEISTQAMRKTAADLMEESAPRRREDGELIKWVLEKLGLWEEEDAEISRKDS